MIECPDHPLGIYERSKDPLDKPVLRRAGATSAWFRSTARIEMGSHRSRAHREYLEGNWSR